MKRKSFIVSAIALVLVLCMAMPAFALGKRAKDLIPTDPDDPTPEVPSIGRATGGRLSKDKIKPLPITPRPGKPGPIEIPVPDPHPGVPNLPI